MRIKKKMANMSAAEAQYVSLVDRGANRIPFRIIKSDGDKSMSIDLSNISHIMKNEGRVAVEATPEVSAIVINKTERIGEVVLALKAAGFNTDDKYDNDDGTVVFPQVEDHEADGTIFKMDDNTLVVLKGFRPYGEELESFDDFVGAQGFYMGLDAATGALRSAINCAMGKATKSEDAKPVIAAATASFNRYVTAMIDKLPQKAFKAEEAVRKGLMPMVTTGSVGSAGTMDNVSLAPDNKLPTGGSSGGMDGKEMGGTTGKTGSSNAAPMAATGSIGAAGTSNGTETIGSKDKVPGEGGEKMMATGTTGPVGTAGTQAENASHDVGVTTATMSSSDMVSDPKASMNVAGLTGTSIPEGSMPISVHINVARKADGSLDMDAIAEQINKQADGGGGNKERAMNLTAAEKAKKDKVNEEVVDDAGMKNRAANKDAMSISKEDLTAMIAASVSAALDGVVRKLDGVITKQGELEAALPDAVKKAELATREVLRNTVVGSALHPDTPMVVASNVRKSDDPRTGSFDTAMIGRRRR